jgi:hypothetical protein
MAAEKIIVLEHKCSGQRWQFLGAWDTWKRAQYEGQVHVSGDCDCSVRLRKFIYAMSKRRKP